MRFTLPVRAGLPGWAVLELNDHALGVPVVALERDFRRYAPDGLFYLPAARAGRLAADHPLNTYAFVIATATPVLLHKLVRSRFIDAILCEPHSRTIIRVTDREMTSLMRAQAGDDLHPGTAVRIIAGDAAGLDGVVQALDGDLAYVRVTLIASQPVVLTCPCNELERR
jgi:hypothetical protein